MKEWEYTFDAVSRAEWIRQITTDLKQKSLASLAGEWWDGEARQPVLHQEDLHDEIVRLPNYLFHQPPVITEDVAFTTAQATEVNSYILSALQQGVQSILFHIPSTETKFNAEWVKNVRLDWITFQVETDTLTNESLHSFLEQMPEHAIFRMVRTESSISLASILSAKKQTSSVDINSIRFIYRFASTGQWTENTSGIFNRLLADLADWEALGFELAAFLQQCILILEADQDYFKQIIQTRVLHLLWHNLNQLYQKDSLEFTNKYLETHIIQNEHEKPEHFLIRASMSALASSLSGSGALCIHHSKDESNPTFFQRINRNIHHLLELESGMYKGVDPLAGAYSLDYPTKLWTAVIWDGINTGK